MTQKHIAKASPKPTVLRDPAVKKRIKQLREAESRIWDEDQIKAEITKIREQQQGLGKLLTDLRKIEQGAAKKKTAKR